MAEKTKKRTKKNTDKESKTNKRLILHNDDYHTFDYVIDALMSICNHQLEQATQCTYIIHNKGKADVKKGSLETLRPMRQAFSARDLKATIE